MTKQLLGTLQHLLRIKFWRSAFTGLGKGQQMSLREEHMVLLYQLSPYMLVSTKVVCSVFLLLHGQAFLTLTLSFLSFECFYFPKLKSNIFILYGLWRSSPQNNWMRSKILETMLMYGRRHTKIFSYSSLIPLFYYLTCVLNHLIVSRFTPDPPTCMPLQYNIQNRMQFYNHYSLLLSFFVGFNPPAD